MPQFHGSQEMFELEDCRLNISTLQALQIVTEDGEVVWLPKSQIERITRDGKDFEPTPYGAETFTIRMTAWIAKQKGFI
jgi:hypothetical protein